jgi:hypothetical protein
MSYNGSGTFQINTSGQPVVAGTVISSTAFNALTADLATGLSTAITKDGQTTTTARIIFAQGTRDNTLTASSAVATDASKNLVSVTNTGTGNNVLATSPTLVTPVLGAASATSITVDAGAVGTPSITTTGDTNTGIFFPAADTIAFAEGGVEAMRINSSGNVGIGTSSPIAYTNYKTLALVGGTTGGVIDINPSTGAEAGGGFQIAATGTSTNIDAYGPTAGTAAFISFRTGTSNLKLPRMKIDGDGNVGIGTSSPDANLTVNGAASFAAGTALLPSIARAGDLNTGIFFPAADTIAFSEGGVEAMRIDSSGNLLVGTTTAVGLANVKSTSNTVPALFLHNSASSGTTNTVISIRKFDNSSATSNVFIQFTINDGATGSGQINANGASSAAFGGFSDVRLKENIADLPSQLANIMALRPVEFDWKNGDGHGIGFIAQEVNEIYPDVVGESADGMLTLTDMNKNDARLIKAIQEMKAIIDTQANTIQSLTTRITALENK